MKKVILITSVLCTMLSQSAAWAGPAESVGQTMTKLMNVLNGANERQKISQLCALVKSDLDYSTIGTSILGNFGSFATDPEGIRDFKGLVPSIIMDQFYGLLNDKSGSEFSVGATVPKGSNRTGVKVTIGTSNFVITVLRSNNKIVDVEWNGYSMVNNKRDEVQRDLAGFHTDKPISALVDRLNNNGVNKCK